MGRRRSAVDGAMGARRSCTVFGGRDEQSELALGTGAAMTARAATSLGSACGPDHPMDAADPRLPGA